MFYFKYLALEGSLCSVGDKNLVSNVVSFIYVKPIFLLFLVERCEKKNCLYCVLLTCALSFLWAVYNL